MVPRVHGYIGIRNQTVHGYIGIRNQTKDLDQVFAVIRAESRPHPCIIMAIASSVRLNAGVSDDVYDLHDPETFPRILKIIKKCYAHV